MRSGGCTVQHTLTAEAAGVVKHAVAVARQRGHAQVTPLHVAATLLAPGGTTLLRRACLKSHPHSTSHPLQCRALELCFKVALNRLPTTAGSVVQPGQPSLSNSLVAVLKRAQANQRRGCVEQQQQPLLGVKVEIEQLIISILDDPSVSRVMREAGFSSTFAKNKVEEESACLSFPSSSLDHHGGNEICRSAAKIKGIMAEAVDMAGGVIYSHNGVSDRSSRFNFFDSPGFERFNGSVKNEDVESVLGVLLGQKTRRINSVIVGDCFLLTENVVRDVMSRIVRGDVPDLLKAVRFVTPHFSSGTLGMPVSREVVEQKLAELRRGINNCLIGGSAIIYVGDLRWVVDDSNGNDNNRNRNGYCPVEHIRMELGRILSCSAESRRVWLMATATYETYMRCQKGQPSLETLWSLQPVPVPSGGLSLTLQPSSTTQGEAKINGVRGDVLVPIPHNVMWQAPPIKTIDLEDEPVDKPNCCSECSAKFEEEAEYVREEHKKQSSNGSHLPLWLQQCSNNNISRKSATAQVEDKLEELRQKWHQICRSKHSHWEQRQRSAFEIPHYSASVSGVNSHRPWWRAPQSHSYGLGVEMGANPTQAWPVLSSPACSHQTTLGNIGDSSIDSVEESSRCDVETTLALGLADTSSQDNNHESSTQPSNPESLKDMTERLAQKVPWQSEANACAIVSAVLNSRSGAVRRENGIKGDTWLLALGPDRMGKRKTAKALAEILFGSQDKLVWFTGKYQWDKLTHAIGLNPNCVVLVEDIEQAEGAFMEALLKALGTGRTMNSNGREVSLSNAVIFLSSTLGTNCFTHCPSSQFDEDSLLAHIEGSSWGLKLMVQEDQEQVGTKLSNHNFKRKPEWDPVKVNQREKRNRQSPVLDLNLETEEQQGIEAGEKLDHIALSDQIRHCFPEQLLKSLDKCLVFLPFDFAQLGDTIVEKLHESYDRATNGRGLFHVESSVVERLVSCCWELAPLGTQTFDKWAEEIFEVWLGRLQSTHTLTSQTIVKLSTTESSNTNSLYGNSHLPTRFEINSCNNHARFSYSA
ncbi:hypothetical protein SUGI_0901390 [Cryptomeria japonica]|uniref:protein SMAX1-LIKE 3 n=1 Tax=Cryptomeria japonica TaxID=3369 RepID=UPI002414792B|nr:protein SMAX1-LIKE 3 [Cryptomeria japonica]GLJ43383.1 hypothetical protein SUGI_0901390 [Cryptomeria japonica]